MRPTSQDNGLERPGLRALGVWVFGFGFGLGVEVLGRQSETMFRLGHDVKQGCD